MAHYFNLQIIIKDYNVEIPNNIMHFINNNYTHVPLENFHEIEKLKSDLAQYETIENLSQNKTKISKVACEVLSIVEKLKIKNFIIEYTEDQGDSYPLAELIVLVIMDNKIVPESLEKNTNDEGEFLSDLYLNFDELEWDNTPFKSYSDAKNKYYK